jgi:copper chaperone CopZ
MCVAHVTKAINSVNGVRSASVSLQEGRAVVEYDEELLAPEAIVNAISEEGYDAQPSE